MNSSDFKISRICQAQVRKIDNTADDWRIRVRIYELHGYDNREIPDDVLPWATPATGLSKTFGMAGVPEVGQEVYVFFENGEIDKPKYFAMAPKLINLEAFLEELKTARQYANDVSVGIIPTVTGASRPNKDDVDENMNITTETAPIPTPGKDASMWIENGVLWVLDGNEKKKALLWIYNLNELASDYTPNCLRAKTNTSFKNGSVFWANPHNIDVPENIFCIASNSGNIYYYKKGEWASWTTNLPENIENCIVSHIYGSYWIIADKTRLYVAEDNRVIFTCSKTAIIEKDEEILDIIAFQTGLIFVLIRTQASYILRKVKIHFKKDKYTIETKDNKDLNEGRKDRDKINLSTETPKMCLSVDNKIYISYGTTIEQYNTNLRFIKDFSFAELNMYFKNHSSIYYDGYIYLWGGYNKKGKLINKLYRINPIDGKVLTCPQLEEETTE